MHLGPQETLELRPLLLGELVHERRVLDPSLATFVSGCEDMPGYPQDWGGK